MSHTAIDAIVPSYSAVSQNTFNLFFILKKREM